MGDLNCDRAFQAVLQAVGKQGSWKVLWLTLPCWLGMPGMSDSYAQSNPPTGAVNRVSAPRAQSGSRTNPIPITTPSRPFIGSQLVINGRRVRSPWSRWEASISTRFSLNDAAAMQQLGLHLLDNPDIQQQPIQWFNPNGSANPVLPSRIVAPFRHLDITDLARVHGWQLQGNGEVLTLTTPPAKVQAVRLGRQAWGDRIVIDLDRPTPWQVDAQSQEFLITLDAQAEVSLPATLPPTLPPGSRLKSLKLEPGLEVGKQTTLRLGIPITLRPRISMLSNPNRLIIDLGAPSLSDRNLQWAPGLRWRQQTLTLDNAQFPVLWFAVNPRQPGLSIRPMLPNPTNLAGTAILLDTARQNLAPLGQAPLQASLAINGGFFNRLNQLPLGAIRLGTQWRSGAILNRGVMAWDGLGQFQFDRYSLQETAIVNGQRFPLTHLNSAYVQAGIAHYTTDWGSLYQSLSDNEVIVTLQSGRIIEQRTLGKAGEAVPLIPSTELLVFRANRTAAASFPLGATVQIDRSETPGNWQQFPFLLGGGPLLLKNSQIVLDARAEGFSQAFADELAARSAIGRTADGTLIIAAVHNRLGGAGASLSHMAQIMQQLGCVDALNYDGGSSTTVYLGGQIVDRPPRSSARIHNAIGIFLSSEP
ncbi:MAG: phosphodiester glycosidase family protein [Synechococcales bacterium]|nr:phosphodiester glycosidase family protein [Synechococcales bacterium]